MRKLVSNSQPLTLQVFGPLAEIRCGFFCVRASFNAAGLFPLVRLDLSSQFLFRTALPSFGELEAIVPLRKRIGYE